MTWWHSFETLSKLQTVLAVLVSLFGVLTLTVKLRADHLKKQADARRAVERAALDKELRDQTTKALKATAALEEKTHHRSISESQERELVAQLTAAPKGKVVITVTESDLEAVTFAGRINGVLQLAGFSVESHSVMMMSGPHGAPVGLIFCIQDISAVPPHAQAIGNAFQRVGIPVQAGPDPNIPRATLGITVGAKPITK